MDLLTEVSNPFLFPLPGASDAWDGGAAGIAYAVNEEKLTNYRNNQTPTWRKLRKRKMFIYSNISFLSGSLWLAFSGKGEMCALF